MFRSARDNRILSQVYMNGAYQGYGGKIEMFHNAPTASSRAA
jgi:hypothetical protein